jgi:nitric oxide reductase NorQ protein
MDPVGACKAALVEGLTDDAEIADALLEVIHAAFGK